MTGPIRKNSILLLSLGRGCLISFSRNMIWGACLCIKKCFKEIEVIFQFHYITNESRGRKKCFFFFFFFLKIKLISYLIKGLLSFHCIREVSVRLIHVELFIRSWRWVQSYLQYTLVMPFISHHELSTLVYIWKDLLVLEVWKCVW